MHSTLATPALAGGAREYALSLDTNSDIYSPKWRPQLLWLVDTLPEETGRFMHQELELLELVQDHINQLEARIKQRIKLTHSMQLVQTLPGLGAILAIVISLEVGSIDRFCAPKHFASYCGLVPKVSSSGGRVHYGRMVTSSLCPGGKQAVSPDQSASMLGWGRPMSDDGRGCHASIREDLPVAGHARKTDVVNRGC